jgi:hypothetical protein
VCANLLFAWWGGGGRDDEEDARVYRRIVVATIATCGLEAFTTQIDNLVLPVFFMSVLSL